MRSAMVGLMLLVAAQAGAGEMVFRARGFEEPPSAAAARSEHTGTAHKYVVADFPGTGSELCTQVKFTPFNDYVTDGDVQFSFNYITNGTSTNASRWRVDIGCPGGTLANVACVGSGNPRACCTGSGTGNCNNYDTITLSTGSTFSVSPNSGAAANVNHNSTTQTLTNLTGCSAVYPVIAQICRNPADGSDTNTDTLSIIDAKFRW